MKKCNKCNGIFQDKYVMCPNCNAVLFETDENAKPTPIGTTKDDFKERISIKLTDTPPIVTCPKCGSTQIQAMKRGWKFTTGFIGSSKIERVCLNCKNKF